MQTAKEKAEELYWYFFQEVADCCTPENLAKTMAIKVIDEILHVIERDENYQNVYSYFLNVKQEIENL